MDIKEAYHNIMGPGGLYLAEELATSLSIKPTEHVLDLACGMGTTSIYLAKKFDCQVTAHDLWISDQENMQRFISKGMDSINAVQSHFYTLPFAHNTFDKVFCMNAYDYFGTDDYALRHLLKFVKVGGLVGIAQNNFLEELDYLALPKHLQEVYFDNEDLGLQSLHCLKWWQRHLEKSGYVEIITARQLENGYKYLTQFVDQKREILPKPLVNAIEIDQGKYFGVFLLVMKKVKEIKPSAI